VSGLEIAALLLACAWLGALTLVVVLLVRQVGLLSLRLSAGGQGQQTFSLDDDGPEVGSNLPEEVSSTLPHLEEGRAYLLLASASCGSCREVLADIGSHRFEQSVTVLIPGQEELSSELARLVPSGVRAVLDPEASMVAAALEIHSTPFAVEVQEGRITRKAYLYNRGSDFVEFVERQEPSEESVGGFAKVASTEETIGRE
jgi:hypothetical protein